MKSRSSRSGARAALRSRTVVRTPIPHTKSLIPSCRMSRSTCRLETMRPCQRSRAESVKAGETDSVRRSV